LRGPKKVHETPLDSTKVHATVGDVGSGTGPIGQPHTLFEKQTAARRSTRTKPWQFDQGLSVMRSLKSPTQNQKMKIVNFVTIALQSANWIEEKQYRIIRKKKLTFAGAARVLSKQMAERGVNMRPSEISVIRIETMLWE
jgi:hypothetical protein